MKNTALVLIALAGLGLLAAGCDTVNTYTSETQNITDSELNDVARVTNVRKSRVSGDLLHVQVDIANIDDTDEVFNYKFEWFDAQGAKLDSPFDSWQRIQIAPRESLTVSATATSPRATDFKLKMILGDE